jgi:LAS superfamily LD-carboxypeptidase LdcB
MRVIEPHQFKYNQAFQPKKRVSRGWLFAVVGIVVVLAVLGGISHYYPKIKKNTKKTAVPVTQTAQKSTPAPAVPQKMVIKSFTSDEFRQLVNSIGYPNTQEITSPPNITGDEAADAQIRKLAEVRGYKLRALAVSSLASIAEGYYLQPKAVQSWQDLQNAASKDGVKIGIAAAFRSIDDQRQLFLTRLYNTGVTADEISSGAVDATINQVLGMTAPPGYSRHHNGFTMDWQCDSDPAKIFVDSQCYAWLSANNYEHTKTYGWIPSYPPGTDNQGPEPEAWEYVWVGMSAVQTPAP